MSPGLCAGEVDGEHQRMVDRVTRALDPEQVENDSNQKMEEFESSNDDSKMEEEPTDSLTLGR